MRQVGRQVSGWLGGWMSRQMNGWAGQWAGSWMTGRVGERKGRLLDRGSGNPVLCRSPPEVYVRVSAACVQVNLSVCAQRSYPA